MPPVRLTRAQQQAFTRERLLAAAVVVVAREGFGGASVDLIAAEAGFSKGAVYSNFASKEALFLELSRQHMERDMAALQAVMSTEPARLSDAVSQWLTTMHADGDLPLLITELQLHARRSPDFARDFYALQAAQTKTLAQILEAYCAALAVPMPLDALDLAGALTALAHGVTLQKPRQSPGSPSEAGRIIENLLHILVRG